MGNIKKSIVPGHGMAVKVIRSNDKHSLEYALRLLKNKVKQAGIMEELRERQEYVKPSAARRKQRDDARRNNRRQQD